MPTPRPSVFYRPDTLPAAQPTASKHWSQELTDFTTIVDIPSWILQVWYSAEEVGPKRQRDSRRLCRGSECRTSALVSLARTIPPHQ